MTGSNVATPTDRVIGYICPVGYYCLEGAVIELACAPGTYQQATGKGEFFYFIEEGFVVAFLSVNSSLEFYIFVYCKMIHFVGEKLAIFNGLFQFYLYLICRLVNKN